MSKKKEFIEEEKDGLKCSDIAKKTEKALDIEKIKENHINLLKIDEKDKDKKKEALKNVLSKLHNEIKEKIETLNKISNFCKDVNEKCLVHYKEQKDKEEQCKIYKKSSEVLSNLIKKMEDYEAEIGKIVEIANKDDIKEIEKNIDQLLKYIKNIKQK